SVPTTQVSRNGGTATAGAGAEASSTIGAPASGSTTAVPRVSASRVTIGHVGDYSGVVGSILGPGGLGMQVAVRYINGHGGLNGHPVQLVVGDAAGDPARAPSRVRDVVAKQGAVAC